MSKYNCVLNQNFSVRVTKGVEMTFKDLVLELESEGIDVKLGILELDSNPIIEARFPRAQPPMFKLFTDQPPLDFSRKYQPSHMFEWIKQKMDTSEKILETQEDLETAVSTARTAFVYVGPLSIAKYNSFLKVK